LFKLLIIAAWGFFAVDAFLVIAAIVSRNTGDDAAGRGVALTFGLVGLAFVLAGGAGLYFSSRAHSWPGAIGSIIPLAVPLLLLFGADVEAYIHKIKSGLDSRKEGRYSKPSQRELAKALAASDFDAMRKILASQPNLSGRDAAGYDLLSYAVMETHQIRSDEENLRQVEGVRLLLDAGMDPNQSRDPDGGSTFAGLAFYLSRATPSDYAADAAATAVFRLFLEHGANPNILREHQPLIFSVWSNLDSLRALLDHGADINLRDDTGDTPLLFYLWNGRWDAALLLLERGADIDVRNNLGTTPEIGIANGKRIAEEIMHKPLPDGYYKVKAALEQRKVSKSH
jgi:ankyrin repeat protein